MMRKDEEDKPRYSPLNDFLSNLINIGARNKRSNSSLIFSLIIVNHSTTYLTLKIQKGDLYEIGYSP